MAEANDDMVQGFLDGYYLDSPEPSDNRSASYRHGFGKGRDDRRGTPRDTHAALVAMAEAAMAADALRDRKD